MAVLTWISTWDDVDWVGTAAFLFWPALVAAITLAMVADRLRPHESPPASPDAGARPD